MGPPCRVHAAERDASLVLGLRGWGARVLIWLLPNRMGGSTIIASGGVFFDPFALSRKSMNPGGFYGC